MAITDAPTAAEVSSSPAHGLGTFLSAYKISLPPIFKCALDTLASKLLISWDSVYCSLCSSEDWLGIPFGWMSK